MRGLNRQRTSRTVSMQKSMFAPTMSRCFSPQHRCRNLPHRGSSQLSRSGSPLLVAHCAFVRLTAPVFGALWGGFACCGFVENPQACALCLEGARDIHENVLLPIRPSFEITDKVGSVPKREPRYYSAALFSVFPASVFCQSRQRKLFLHARDLGREIVLPLFETLALFIAGVRDNFDVRVE